MEDGGGGDRRGSGKRAGGSRGGVGWSGQSRKTVFQAVLPMPPTQCAYVGCTTLGFLQYASHLTTDRGPGPIRIYILQLEFMFFSYFWAGTA